MAADRVPLEASRTSGAGGLGERADPAPSDVLEATILVRRRPDPAARQRMERILSGEAERLSREDAEECFGADAEDLRLVEEFAAASGLETVESSAAKRWVRVSGTVARMESAFGVKLRFGKKEGGVYLCYQGVLTIPASLADIIVGVLGLDQRPVARL